MSVITKTRVVKTTGEVDIIDLTDLLKDYLTQTTLTSGIVTVFVGGSTVGITTIEYEPGLKSDLPRVLDRLFPKGDDYSHNGAWGDGNGHSHIRSVFMPPSITIPFVDSAIQLGRWQQVVLVEFDVRPRARNVIFQFMGE